MTSGDGLESLICRQVGFTVLQQATNQEPAICGLERIDLSCDKGNPRESSIAQSNTFRTCLSMLGGGRYENLSHTKMLRSICGLLTSVWLADTSSSQRRVPDEDIL